MMSINSFLFPQRELNISALLVEMIAEHTVRLLVGYSCSLNEKTKKPLHFFTSWIKSAQFFHFNGRCGGIYFELPLLSGEAQWMKRETTVANEVIRPIKSDTHITIWPEYQDEAHSCTNANHFIDRGSIKDIFWQQEYLRPRHFGTCD